MDAHIFRRFCHALTPFLSAARLEKIQSPIENVFVFTFYAQHEKRHLVMKVGKKNPFLYFAAERPVANSAPSAMVMRWRKYCSGRRITFCTFHWTERKIYLLFRGAGVETVTHTVPQTWLVLDMREGPQLLLDKNPLENTPSSPIFPEITETETLSALCENWRNWPVITPALRRTLPLLNSLDSQALMVDLETGGGDIYVYGEGQDAELSAWPLPPELIKNRAERIFEDPLAATGAVGNALVFGTAASVQRQEAALPQKREATRLIKLLAKLDNEEERLKNMLSCQEKALILQHMLWRMAPETKLALIETEHKAMPTLQLDPRLTVRENMQALFHTAARGKRGLAFLTQRRESLQQQLAMVQNTAHVLSVGGNIASAQCTKNTKDTKATKNKKTDRMRKKEQENTPKNLTQLKLPKGVQAFKSSDGFLILRGKDSKGNWAALRAASPQDIWLHVEGGPGSHCVIRRHFAGQDIPVRTLHEAASLAAVKSWQKDNPTAHILCAQVRHVKPMRNTATGTVRIDKAMDSFRVDIMNDIENKLALRNAD